MSDFYIDTDLHPTIALLSELQYISKITQKKIKAKKDNDSCLFEKTNYTSNIINIMFPSKTFFCI